MNRNSARKARALVTGGAGQDGWYLVELLVSLGYEVAVHSRSTSRAEPHFGPVTWHTGALCDEHFLEDLLTSFLPDQIYNLAAVSRPALSWDMPIETAQLNAMVPQRICEFIRRRRPECRLFQASSSEIFGVPTSEPQDESTPPNPKSPYGVSKAFAHQIVGAYRDQYGLHLSSGIMFNHESPRRPLNFVSQKIAHAAAAASLGLSDTKELDERGKPILRGGKLYLGDISIRRDFGFAGDFVQAMHLIVTSATGGDYVIGTGESHSIAEFCQLAFERVGLDWEKYVIIDQSLVRKVDSHRTRANYAKLKATLGWTPKVTFPMLVGTMVEDRRRILTLEMSRSPSCP